MGVLTGTDLQACVCGRETGGRSHLWTVIGMGTCGADVPAGELTGQQLSLKCFPKWEEAT